jgi:hypothetical protein
MASIKKSSGMQYITVWWIGSSETSVPVYESTRRDVLEDRNSRKCFSFHVVIQKYQDAVLNPSSNAMNAWPFYYTTDTPPVAAS